MCKVYCIGSFMNSAGAQEALVRVSRQLRLRGYGAEVRFLYQEKLAFRHDAHVRAIKARPELSAFGYVSAFLALLGELKKERPAAVICFMPLGTVVGCLAAAMAGVKIRIASQRAPGPTFGRVMRILDRLWGTFNLYTKIICVSEAVRDSFANYPTAYREKLSVVHNGIEWQGSGLDREQARARFNLPANRLIFVAVGRISFQKNYLFLLERLRDVKDMYLVIAGDGDDRPDIERFIENNDLQDRVMLLGAIDHSAVVDLYAAADIFIQTSIYEGQSNATLEAMHAGLPIITSDISMQRETLCSDGDYVGKLVSLDRPDVWNECLGSLMSSDEERVRLGSAAKDFVQRRFSLNAMIDGFEGALKGCAR